MVEKFKLNIYDAIGDFEVEAKEFVLRSKYYKPLFKGRGLDFDGYRDYAADDDASSIDWVASKKSNKLLVRQYVEEKNSKVIFAIDVGSGMVFGSGDKLKCEYAGELVAALTNLILKSGDRAGFHLFSDDVKNIIPPQKNREVVNQLVELLEEPKNYGGLTRISEALDHLIDHLDNSVSSVVIVSDFIGLSEKDLKYLRLISSRFETIAIRVRDRMDVELPDVSGEVVLEDPTSGQQMVVNPKVARASYGSYVRKKDEELKGMFEDYGVSLLDLVTDKSFVHDLGVFLRERVEAGF